jgi:membrane-associated phospholipid phosphatase
VINDPRCLMHQSCVIHYFLVDRIRLSLAGRLAAITLDQACRATTHNLWRSGRAVREQTAQNRMRRPSAVPRPRSCGSTRAADGSLFLACFVPRLGRPGWRAALAAAMLALALAVGASRVYLGYHTRAQVGAGLAVGTTCAVAWLGLYATVLRSRLGAWVAASRVCAYLMVRDCAHMEDVVAWEYDGVMQRRRGVKRK